MAGEGQTDSTAERQIFVDSVLQGARENAEASMVSHIVPTHWEMLISNLKLPEVSQPFMTIVREKDGQKIRLEDRTSYDPKGLLAGVLNGFYTADPDEEGVVVFDYVDRGPWGSSTEKPVVTEFKVSMDQATNMFLLSGRALGFGREDLGKICSSYYEKGDFSKWPEHLVPRRFLPTLRARLQEASSSVREDLVEGTTEPVVLRQENTLARLTLNRLQTEKTVVEAKAAQLGVELADTRTTASSLREETSTLRNELEQTRRELEAAERRLEEEKLRKPKPEAIGASVAELEQLVRGLDQVQAEKLLIGLKRGMLGALHPDRFKDDPVLASVAEEFYKDQFLSAVQGVARRHNLKIK